MVLLEDDMIEMSKGEIKRRRLMMQVDRAMKLLLALVVVIVAAMSLTSCVPSGSDIRNVSPEAASVEGSIHTVSGFVSPRYSAFRAR